MSSEPQPETPASEEPTAQPADGASRIPLDLSEFSQRLANFGLGESPDPLLTDARPPGKRRSQS